MAAIGMMMMIRQQAKKLYLSATVPSVG